MQLGVQAGDVLTHANGQGLAKMAPKDIAKLLVPRPLKLHVQRYAPLSPAALPPVKAAGVESVGVVGGVMEDEQTHGELINLLQARYKEAMWRIAELEAAEEEEEEEELPESIEELQGEVRRLRSRNRQLQAQLKAGRDATDQMQQRHDDRIYLLQTELDRLREENDTHLLLARTALTPERG